MFPILRRHWALWAIWTAGAMAILFINPFGPFGWAELAAGLGSLILVATRRVRRELLLVIGLPGIALLATLDAAGPSVSRFVADWFCFVGAVLLAARAVDDQRELEAIAGQAALGPDHERALAEFRADMADEVARARRHERSFVVLSVAPRPGEVPPGPLASDSTLHRLAQARWSFELAGVLRDSLHSYAGVVATEGRVLCCVPEIEDAAVGALIERLNAAVREVLAIEIQAGFACFPKDALGVEDLIQAADEARTRLRLETVSDAKADGGVNGGASARAAANRLRDVRG